MLVASPVIYQERDASRKSRAETKEKLTSVLQETAASVNCNLPFKINRLNTQVGRQRNRIVAPNMSFGRWRSGVREKTGLNRRLSGRGSNQSSSTNILSCTANRVAAQAFPSASCVKWGYSAGLRPRMGETQTMAPAKTAEELTTGEQEITKTNGQKRGSRKTCSRDERKKRGRGRFERWEGRRRTGRVEDGGGREVEVKGIGVLEFGG
ncbi:hypothetical protein GX48_02725 [Paracoccidioides brasiliensis]|nr:hypothetical protein GX48_02725 [Paracoccidioides brasiliensis]